MRRAATLLVLGATVSAGTAPARAGDAPLAPLAPSAAETAPATVRNEFGWQILAADVGAVVFTFVAAEIGQRNVVLFPYVVMAPSVHLAHADYSGTIESLILRLALPLAGWYVGQAIDPPDCAPGKECDDWFDWGAPLGALAGVSLASALDAVYLAQVERPAADTITVTRHRLSAVPALGVDPNGRVSLSLAARF